MSNVVKDKFLTEFEKQQEENGMWGGRRYALADAKKWKDKQPLTEDEASALERRERRGFILLVTGVAVLLVGAIVICIMQSQV